MTAIFNNYHNLSYDTTFIQDHIRKTLSLKPAGFAKEEIDTFFSQHVALECIYHLKLTEFYSYVIPFLNDIANFHSQVSAARALISYNTPECKQELVKIITDPSRENFVKIIAIWTLAHFQPSEIKQTLIELERTASEEANGFGGNIMDPRVCTYIPDVKVALNNLISTL